MSDDAAVPNKKGGGAKMLIVGVALAAVLGGGGFFAVYSGMVALPLPPANAPETAEGDHGEAAKTADAHGAAEDAGMPPAPPVVSFAPLDPILVTLGGSGGLKQLQLVAQLEVEPGAAEQVAGLQPRVRDVLTTYLRAVSPADVEDPAALLRMRAQMLRRIQVVAGEGAVRDLLVSEFVVR